MTKAYNFSAGPAMLPSAVLKKINEELLNLKHKIKLISNNDLDYLDMLYREKLRYGTKDEIIIRLK